MAVSYTHLDVYKRQPTSAPQPTSTPDNNGGSNTAPDDSSADKAKQYIGQDVYKRQPRRC